MSQVADLVLKLPAETGGNLGNVRTLAQGIDGVEIALAKPAAHDRMRPLPVEVQRGVDIGHAFGAPEQLICRELVLVLATYGKAERFAGRAGFEQASPVQLVPGHRPKARRVLLHPA